MSCSDDCDRIVSCGGRGTEAENVVMRRLADIGSCGSSGAVGASLARSCSPLKYIRNGGTACISFSTSHYSDTPNTSNPGISFRLNPHTLHPDTSAHWPVHLYTSYQHPSSSARHHQPFPAPPPSSSTSFLPSNLFRSIFLSTFNFFQPQADLARCTWQ